MALITQLVGHFVSGDRPILMPDACAILDSVRGPARGDLKAIMHARAVIAAQKAGDCDFVRASVTSQEVADHLPSAKAELVAYLGKHETALTQVNQLCNILNKGLMTVSPPAWSTTLPNLSEQCVNDVMAAAQPIDHDCDRSKRAGDRVLYKRAPAASKGEFEDALMVEELIELTAALRSTSFTRPVVLLSSNFKDFCAPQTKLLHSQLVAEFSPLNIQFALNWESARRLLT